MTDELWNLDTAEKIKEIKYLVKLAPGQQSLIEYLGSVSDLVFSSHASEMRYGETCYFRGVGRNVKALVLPTQTLSALPRAYRKPNWFFVKIYCHPDDLRFDTLPGYESVLAQQYDI